MVPFLGREKCWDALFAGAAPLYALLLALPRVERPRAGHFHLVIYDMLGTVVGLVVVARGVNRPLTPLPEVLLACMGLGRLRHSLCCRGWPDGWKSRILGAVQLRPYVASDGGLACARRYKQHSTRRCQGPHVKSYHCRVPTHTTATQQGIPTRPAGRPIHQQAHWPPRHSAWATSVI